jgi:hypothetical protein
LEKRYGLNTGIEIMEIENSRVYFVNSELAVCLDRINKEY